MKRVHILTITALLLIFPFSVALAGGGAEFDAKVIKQNGEKVLFGQDGTLLRYVHFCGSFSGAFYFGANEKPLKVDPKYPFKTFKELPLNATVHFSGGITGGTGDDKSGYNYCLTDGFNTQIAIEAQPHTVKKGDTLWEIIKENGGNPYDYEVIAGYNAINNPNRIKTGQLLWIPNYGTSILTSKNFTGVGLKPRDADPKDAYFKIEINPLLQPYTFHVTSFTPTSQGKIEISSGYDEAEPPQTITLNPTMRMADEVPTWFNAQDINFDGFLDIGVLVDGGAKWGAYQYWVFDQKTGTFKTSPATEEFLQISFNDIEFDQTNKRITTSNLIGAIGDTKSVYQFQNGHFKLMEEKSCENTDSTHSEITLKTYKGKKATTTKQTLNRECQPGDF